jgi:Uncharacterized protein conserved in bacteria (DUF2059)
MRRSGRISFAVAVLLGCAGAARAAEPARVPSSYETAARELCHQVCGAGTLQAGAEMMTRVVNNPELAGSEDVVRGWYVSVIGLWDREAAMAEDYESAFSEQEIRDLLAFYRTPLGQKALAELPSLVRKESELLGREMTAHQPELEAVLKPRLAELEEKQNALEEKKP